MVRHIRLEPLVVVFFALNGLAPGVLAQPKIRQWTRESSLPAPVHAHAMVAARDCLYVIGGKTKKGAPTSDVLFARIGRAGSLETWRKTTPLPVPLEGHTAVVCQDRIYVIAERNHSGNRRLGVSPATVAYIGVIAGDGAIMKWTATEPVPTEARYYGNAVCRGNVIYYIGGRHCRKSFRSTLQSEGALCPWSSDQNVKFIRSHFGVASCGQYVYLLGGQSVTEPVDTVMKAMWLADGSLGPWTLCRGLPLASSSLASFSHGKSLFCIGGNDGSRFLSDVWQCEVSPDGVLKEWVREASFPVPVSEGAAAVRGNAVYYSGGITDASLVQQGDRGMSTVYRATIATTKAKAGQ